MIVPHCGTDFPKITRVIRRSWCLVAGPRTGPRRPKPATDKNNRSWARDSSGRETLGGATMTVASFVDSSRAHQESSMRLVVVAASLGTVFEWYDFFLYGSLAVFFSALFFPPGNETAAFLASLATFGAGFAVRPFGALVFGALGDRIGRKRSFLITMVIMGLSTVVVGLLPTYAQVGMWAPVLLVTMRLAQGLAVGGEYGGAAI